ncbi:MAG TPA: efflux RND transporter periplasmic adaptor subunit [Trichormus sp.]|jgi:HlyD family secretion protein
MILGSRTQEAGETTKTGGGRKWLVVALLLLVVIAVGVGCYFYFGHKEQDWHKNVAMVERGPIDVQILATGTIKPLNEIKVSPKSTGLVKKLLVKQGDRVTEDQVLAQMDDSNIQGQVESARGTYLMAKDNYEKMEHGNRPQEVAIARLQERRARDIVHQAEQNVIRLRAQLESMTQQAIRDDSNADRQQYLNQEGAASDQDELNAETQSKMTRAQLDAAKRELAQSEGVLAQNRSEFAASQKQLELSRIGNREEDIQAAKHAVLQAKGNLDTLISQLNDMTIKAPFAGVITQKYADAGAIVTPTTSAATTSATSSSIVALAGALEVVAEVAETDIGKIKIDEPVEIVSNAFPEHTFHGTVTQIAPEAVVTQNVTTFEVHATIDDDRKGKLLSGMNVQCRFVVGKMPDALLVPTVCITSKHGKTGVLLAQPDGTPKFQRVKVGPTVDTKTAIVKGVKEGDQVFLGLSRDQLEQQGYEVTDRDHHGGGGRGEGGPRGHGGGAGGAGGPPIPRSFGH